jgi:hypothetical protein
MATVTESVGPLVFMSWLSSSVGCNRHEPKLDLLSVLLDPLAHLLGAVHRWTDEVGSGQPVTGQNHFVAAGFADQSAKGVDEDQRRKVVFEDPELQVALLEISEITLALKRWPVHSITGVCPER